MMTDKLTHPQTNQQSRTGGVIGKLHKGPMRKTDGKRSYGHKVVGGGAMTLIYVKGTNGHVAFASKTWKLMRSVL